jgi:peptidoglycan/LPS O-acetylase OafA/YrhL
MCLKRVVVAFHPVLAAHSAIQAAAPATSLRYTLACLFFIPARDAMGNVVPIVNAGWTLNLEMFFYVLFAIALLFKIRPVRFLTPVMLVLATVGVLRPSGRPPIAALTDPILLEFLAGVLLAYAVRGGFRISLSLAALLGLAGFAALFFLSPGSFALARELEWGVPAFFILLAAVMLEQRYGRLWPAWILKIGDASYSLYLIHVLLRQPLLGVARRVPLAQAHVTVFVVGGLALSLPVALLSYWLVEKHLTGMLSRLTSTAIPITVEREKVAA